MSVPDCQVHGCRLEQQPRRPGTSGRTFWKCPRDGCTVGWWGNESIVPADQETRTARSKLLLFVRTRLPLLIDDPDELSYHQTDKPIGQMDMRDIADFLVWLLEDIPNAWIEVQDVFGVGWIRQHASPIEPMSDERVICPGDRVLMPDGRWVAPGMGYGMTVGRFKERMQIPGLLVYHVDAAAVLEVDSVDSQYAQVAQRIGREAASRRLDERLAELEQRISPPLPDEVRILGIDDRLQGDDEYANEGDYWRQIPSSLIGATVGTVRMQGVRFRRIARPRLSASDPAVIQHGTQRWVHMVNSWGNSWTVADMGVSNLSASTPAAVPAPPAAPEPPAIPPKPAKRRQFRFE